MIMKNEKTCGGKNYTLEELVQLYIDTKNEIYFNELWNNVKAFSVGIGNKFVTISYEDKISIAMEVLFRCIPKLKNNKGKLLTYYGFALKCEYVSYLEKQKTKKYEFNKDAYSLDQLKEDVNFEPITRDDEFNIEDFINTNDLDKLESLIVKLLNEGYKAIEIRNTLKITLNEYKKILFNIQEKINNYSEKGFTM